MTEMEMNFCKWNYFPDSGLYVSAWCFLLDEMSDRERCNQLIFFFVLVCHRWKPCPQVCLVELRRWRVGWTATSCQSVTEEFNGNRGVLHVFLIGLSTTLERYMHENHACSRPGGVYVEYIVTLRQMSEDTHTFHRLAIAESINLRFSFNWVDRSDVCCCFSLKGEPEKLTSLT